MSFPTRGTSLCEFSGLCKAEIRKVSFYLQDYLEFRVKLKEYKKVGLGLAWGADLNLVHNWWHMSFIWIYFEKSKTQWNLVSSGDLEWVIFWEILWLKCSALPGNREADIVSPGNPAYSEVVGLENLDLKSFESILEERVQSLCSVVGQMLKKACGCLHDSSWEMTSLNTTLKWNYNGKSMVNL